MAQNHRRRYTDPSHTTAKGQKKPKEALHHTHIMEAWGSDPRFKRCTQAGCQYAESNGKAIVGPNERSRDASAQFEVVDMFTPDEMDTARFSHRLKWGEASA